MATLLLTAAGAALGGAFGTVGAVVGQAAGAIVGSLVDQALFGTTREVGRVSDIDVQTSTEGAPIPRVFGRARVAGQVIWATRFEEEAETSGGKGLGPKVRSYRYFANVAIGLCEGPIAHVGRVWANGELLDTTRVIMRVHRGGEGEAPDSLILAKEGTAPAYRGTAVVVFEHLPLADTGNALPQFTFEVIRPVGRLERMVRAVTLIPGATEYGYSPQEVQRVTGEGSGETENRHAAHAPSDVEAALDELTAVCPNLEAVALVVAWFGDSLDCAACTVRPKVEDPDKEATAPWQVAGLGRGAAAAVSRVAGKPAFGGTPDDAGVVALIKALKARGLQVTVYPFVMMDVPPGNALPDPHGGVGQPAYPWRGRVTVQPAPGRPGSPDGTPAAASAVAAFTGTAAPGHFGVADGAVTYDGPAEWSYRRMVLHYAALAKAAGGVHGFLIGSEFRGLTRVRREEGRHPFVEALIDIAADVRSMLGPATEIGYAADWSEYFGHHPDDGSGDVTFHLDPLWAHPAIDFVGIDAYFPLTDWRDGPHPGRAAAAHETDLRHLRANVAGGEYFDWSYASDADRRAGLRSPITDGAAQKPWVFRPKDLVGWWSNRHYDRVGGVEKPTPTAWLPGMKPIRFTELGCPAVDRGANQPNVFPDRLSSEGASPWFSHGRRDDAAQRRYLEAVLGWFDPEAAGFAESRNPRLTPGGPRMVDAARSFLWAFDARPYPWFPLADDVWSDGPNWTTGHWLNGRLGAAPLGECVVRLAAGEDVGTLDVEGLPDVVDGIVVADRSSAREVVDGLAGLFRLTVVETATGLRFSARDGRVAATVAEADLVDQEGRPQLEIRRAEGASVPTEVAVTFLDGEAEGRQTTVTARRGGPVRALDLALPVTAAKAVMAGAAEALLVDLEDGRERLSFALAPTRVEIEPGDLLTVAVGGRAVPILVERIEDTGVRRIEARTVDPLAGARSAGPVRGSSRPKRAKTRVRPLVVVLDLPLGADRPEAHQPFLAAASDPWPGTLSAYLKVGGGYVAVGGLSRPATLGVLATPLAPGRIWVFDRGAMEVTLSRGALASVDDEMLLAGANLAAVGDPANGWELIQFGVADLVGAGRYRLTRLVRGRDGTEERALAGAPAGSRFVLVDGALGRLQVDAGALGSTRSLRVGPADRDLGDPSMRDLKAAIGGAALLPFAPVRLSTRRLADGSVAISWIRRTRVGGDLFDAPEVPLGEAAEGYEITIADGSGPRRTLSAAGPAVVYPAAEALADFGAPPATMEITVRQLSQTAGPGRPARRLFHV